jgi:hypothetical protein
MPQVCEQASLQQILLLEQPQPGNPDSSGLLPCALPDTEQLLVDGHETKSASIRPA